MMRLQKYLSKAGVASRRKSEELIREGRVKVNGRVAVVGESVEPMVDTVLVGETPVALQELFYGILNKPKGCLCTMSDPGGRETIFAYVPGVPSSVRSVGRLDYYSEGVLLLTNDGDLHQGLLAPHSHVEKTYHVKLQGVVNSSQIRKLREGVVLDDGYKTAPCEVDRLKTKSKHDWLVVTLREGKNRQIHRMIESLGGSVSKIQRVAFAGITFHGLRVGDARELTQKEVNALRTHCKLPKNSVSRGTWAVKRESTDISRRRIAAARGDEYFQREKTKQKRKRS